MTRQSGIQAMFKRFTIRLMLGLMLFSTFSSALALSVSAVDNGSSWTYCATEQESYCNFSGTKEVRYGADSTSPDHFTTGIFTDGIDCTTEAIGHGDPAEGTKKSCYTRDVQLDSGVMTTVVSNLHKTVTVTFNVYAGQSGTDEDLKSKITVKRSGQDYFAELGEGDTVTNLASSDTSSTLIIHLDQALVGAGNTIRIGSGAFLNADNDAYEQTVEIGPIVFEAPKLTEDTTDNNNKKPITVTFNDDALWRQAITEVWDGGSLLKSTDYNVSAGAITLSAGVLVSGNHTLLVKASGYADASVSQQVDYLFSGSGTGTQSDPYQIATPGQLNEIRDLNANNTYFKLVDNIDLSGYSNWAPIGPNDNSPFKGVLDGNGFKITNLMITSNDNFRGLFGIVTGQLMNIRLEQVLISTAGFYYTGGLAAVNYGTISNSSVTGKVTGSYNTGGLTGLNGGMVTKSYSEAEVKGFTFTGGLVGQNQGTVTNSYATGNLSTAYSGFDYSGGLIGYATSGTVSNSYATGNVVTSDRSGGLVGTRLDHTSVTDSYYDSETTHQLDSDKGTGQSTADMKNQAKYSGWDFTSIWFMGTDSYPQLWSAVGLSQGTEGGTTKLEHVASGLEYSVDDGDYYPIRSSVADNIAAVAGDEITVRMISNPSSKLTLIVRLPDLHPGDAPETAVLEVGTSARTTKLIGVSEGMEYKVKDGSYKEILDTTVDNIAVNAGDRISVRQAASTSAPATLSQVLTVALTDIKPVAAPTTGELEQGMVGGTTKLIGVSAAMEYKVNDGLYQKVEATSVDNIHAGVGGTISVRVAATTLQPASETQVLTVQPSEANPLSADATLSGLTLSGVTLSSKFDSGTLVYTAEVANNVTSTTVAATASEANATVTAADLGAKSVVVGENVIIVHVTAQDGITTKEYKVTVTRVPSADATLSGLTFSGATLSPEFDSGTLVYTAEVPNNVTSTMVAATVSEANATVTAADLGAKSLVVGENVITVHVTAQDGSAKSEYKVTVTRVPSADATLSDLTLSGATLSPEFDSGILVYTAEVANNVTSTTVAATASEANATVTAADLGAKSLVVGENVITVHVTAQDGSTKSEYKVTVTRAPSADATLSGLTFSGATLSPEFDSGTLVYTAEVANNVTSTTVAATTSEANATVTAADLGAKSLVVGKNVITVHVTAQDGSTKSEYKVTVTRASLPVVGGDVPSSTEDSIIASTDGTLTLPEGRTGRVSLGDAVTIFIPKGAISKELRLTIEKITDALSLITTKDKLASAVFEIKKNFTENFSSPVTLTFTFDPTSVGDKQTVAIFYYDEVKKIWVEVGGQVNGNKISAEVNHFTKYAVFVIGEDDQEKTELVTFSDIAGHWAEASIKQAVKDGIVNGYSDGTFKPGKSITRAEFAVMLANALKLQEAATEPSFKDASQIGAWANAAVAQAQQAGLIQGGSDGNFRPNDVITRAEMAVMIARVMGQAAEAVQTTGFADEESIPVWAKDSTAYVKEMGIMQGKGGNKFAPNDATTRAEAVTVLLTMLANKNK